MLLNALYFFVFIIVTLLLFYKTKQHLLVLFFVSLLFIAFIQWKAIPLLLLNSLCTFYLGQHIASSSTRKNRLFALGICIIIGQLILFKIFALSGNILSGFSAQSLAITLGLSFYSLQNIAYLFDVKIGRIPAENNALLYVASTIYFPKILCGPVVVYQQVKTALITAPLFKQENLLGGLNRFVFGAFKKLVLADRLAPMAAAVFDANEPFHGFTSLFAGLVFTLHVYFDFSGYVDMALGISKMFGITLPENFFLPLRAQSITQFWRRWHISLMQWLTHYVYYPVSYWFRKNAFLSAFLGIVITLLFSSFWHGLGLTFLLWAFCHIVYLTIELIAQTRNIKLPEWISFPFTILAVSFANLFFRAADISTAKKLISEIFDSESFIPHDWVSGFVAVFGRGAELNDLFNFSLSWTFILLFLLFEKTLIKKSSNEKFSLLWLTTLLLLIAIFGIFNSGEEFIYSRF